MKKANLRVLSVFLILALLCSTLGFVSIAEEPATQTVTQVTEEEVTENGLFSYLTDPDCNPDEISNAVVIPGLFQSNVKLYDENGNVAKNSAGEEYEGPFFLESVGDIVKLALKKALVPLLLTLVFQHDPAGWLSDSVADVLGEVLAERVKCDKNGDFVYNVKADSYPDSVATLSQEDKDYIYDQIPLNDYAEIVGEEHLFFYSYASFGNLNDIVDELYALILKAASTSPTGKVNIVPISQGGSLANDLLDRHADVGQYLDRIVYIIPALDGSTLLGEIFDKGLIDDDESLYREMLPILINDDDTPWLGNLITVILRILPNKTVNDILDKAVDTLIEDYLGNSTCMWGLVPQANYPHAAEKYLSDEDDAVIKAQTDRFYQAQIDSDKNIKYQMDTYGVKVFDIVDYNCALYPICDSWDSLNADGIIQIDSTSMGATSVAVDVQLPADYTPVAGGKYVDPYNLVDAGTGLIPDQTFYFHNQNHERTGRNDVIMKLAICLLTDNNFTSVESYPESFPQFNEGRNSGSIEGAIAGAKKMLESGTLSAADEATLKAALKAAEDQLATTVVDPVKFEQANTDLRAAMNTINGVSTEPTTGDKIGDAANKGAATIIELFSKILFSAFGGKGFGDVVREVIANF